jgi:hypothetical protein
LSLKEWPAILQSHQFYSLLVRLALEGNAEDARDIIRFHHRVAVLIIDHQSKPQAGQRYQDKRPFGSTYKGLLARSVVQVKDAERGDNLLKVRLRQTKHNFGPLAEPFLNSEKSLTSIR